MRSGKRILRNFPTREVLVDVIIQPELTALDEQQSAERSQGFADRCSLKQRLRSDRFIGLRVRDTVPFCPRDVPVRDHSHTQAWNSVRLHTIADVCVLSEDLLLGGHGQEAGLYLS